MILWLASNQTYIFITTYFENVRPQDTHFLSQSHTLCRINIICSLRLITIVGDEEWITLESRKSRNNSSSQVWNFVSAPDLHPMKVNINVNKSGTAPGLIFVAPYTSYESTMIGQTGALILDQAGNPVWFSPLESRYIQNTDFRVQTYKGRPVLTMWQGTISGTQSANPNLPAGDPEPGAFFPNHKSEL